jgi:peptidoglycan hydrolase-like protein with peptidoglycan-binding domain
MPARHRAPTRAIPLPTRVALAAIATTALAVAAYPSAAAGAPVAGPRPPRPLPAAVDVRSTYLGQNSCDPVAKPGLEAYVRLVLTTYRVGHSGGIVRGCGLGSTSEHKEGRAFDYMLSIHDARERAAGDSLTRWLTGRDSHGVTAGNARRLGVMYVIWNRRFWSVYTGRWRAYTGPNPHTDHVHTSFSWDGAMHRTSWWDGTTVTVLDQGTCAAYAGQPAPVYTRRRTTVCPTDLPAAPRSAYPIIWPGQSTGTVRVAQQRLNVTADGVFGSTTRTRLMGWQRAARLPVTGVLDKPTWARLAPAGSVPAFMRTALTRYRKTTIGPGAIGPAVSMLQRALGIAVDGAYGPDTTAVVRDFQRARRLPATGFVSHGIWDAIEGVAYPLLPYRGVVVREGSRGAAVTRLQWALKIPGDGAFGAQTASALQAAQQAAGLPADGITDPDTWIAVERAAYPFGRRLVPAAGTPAAVSTPAPTPAPTPTPEPVAAPTPRPRRR